MKKTEEFRVSLILTKIGFEQIRKKIHFLFLQTNQKKSKGERIHKIQQEFSQHESCLLSKHDFVFGGEGGGGRGWVHCGNPAAQAAAKDRLHAWLSFSVFCLLCFVFWKRFKFKFPLIFEISCKYSDNLVVIISLHTKHVICQQVTYPLADTRGKAVSDFIITFFRSWPI